MSLFCLVRDETKATNLSNESSKTKKINLLALEKCSEQNPESKTYRYLQFFKVKRKLQMRLLLFWLRMRLSLEVPNSSLTQALENQASDKLKPKDMKAKELGSEDHGLNLGSGKELSPWSLH